VFKLFWSKIITVNILFVQAVSSFAQNVDPTKPLSSYGIASVNSLKKEGAMVLETIVYSEQVRTAVINGKILKVGDTIGEYKMLAVNDKSVILGLDEERLKLTLFSEIVVKSP